MKKRNFLVPVFKDSGKLANGWYAYHMGQGKHSDRTMVPNFEINLHLFLTQIRPTRGSFRAVFQDLQGHDYYMMGSDFNALLNRAEPNPVNPVFDGTFTVSHKSYDYTIRLVDPAKDEPLNEAKMVDMMNNPRRLEHV
jgi:hypothetical protein